MLQILLSFDGPIDSLHSFIAFERISIFFSMFQVPGEEEFGATSAAELLLDEELVDFHAVRVSLTERYASHQPIWGFVI